MDMDGDYPMSEELISDAEDCSEENHSDAEEPENDLDNMEYGDNRQSSGDEDGEEDGDKQSEQGNESDGEAFEGFESEEENDENGPEKSTENVNNSPSRSSRESSPARSRSSRESSPAKSSSSSAKNTPAKRSNGKSSTKSSCKSTPTRITLTQQLMNQSQNDDDKEKALKVVKRLQDFQEIEIDPNRRSSRSSGKLNFSLFSDDPERVAKYMERPVKVVMPRPSKTLENNEPSSESPESSQGSQVASSWVQCENPRCLKWRRIPTETAEALGDEAPWFCSMNADDAHNQCDDPQEDYMKEERRARKQGLIFVESCLQEGTLVWAKMAGFCKWPALICRDPGSGVSVKRDEWNQIFAYHVEFLGKSHSHSWLYYKHIYPYGLATSPHTQASQKGSAVMSVDKKKRRSGGRREPYQDKQVQCAQREADALLDVPTEERLKHIKFPHDPNVKVKAPPQKQAKKKKKPANRERQAPFETHAAKPRPDAGVKSRDAAKDKRNNPRDVSARRGGSSDGRAPETTIKCTRKGWKVSKVVKAVKDPFQFKSSQSSSQQSQETATATKPRPVASKTGRSMSQNTQRNDDDDYIPSRKKKVSHDKLTKGMPPAKKLKPAATTVAPVEKRFASAAPVRTSTPVKDRPTKPVVSSSSSSVPSRNKAHAQREPSQSSSTQREPSQPSSTVSSNNRKSNTANPRGPTLKPNFSKPVKSTSTSKPPQKPSFDTKPNEKSHKAVGKKEERDDSVQKEKTKNPARPAFVSPEVPKIIPKKGLTISDIEKQTAHRRQKDKCEWDMERAGLACNSAVPAAAAMLSPAVSDLSRKRAVLSEQMVGNKLEGRTKEEKFQLDVQMYQKNEAAFEHDVKRFMLRHGIRPTKGICWQGKPVHLFSLFMAVYERQGFYNVEKNKAQGGWRAVYEELSGVRMKDGSTARRYYERNLLAYEMYIKGKEYKSYLPTPEKRAEKRGGGSSSGSEKENSKRRRAEKGQAGASASGASNGASAVQDEEDLVSESALDEIDKMLNQLDQSNQSIVGALENSDKLNISLKYNDDDSPGFELSPQVRSVDPANEFSTPAAQGGAQEVPPGVRRPSTSGSCLSDEEGSEDFEVLHEMESLQQELELMNEYLL